MSNYGQGDEGDEGLARYISFTRREWALLRAATPMTLSAADLVALQGLNDRLSLDEVAEVYLPLARLLNLYVAATRTLHQATGTFLGKPVGQVPFIVAIAGSVAVGKSTTARVLQALLAHWPQHPAIDLVTTDGFLYPNRVLEARGLMSRKGFPESYDLRRLVRFLADLKSGRTQAVAPVYSHLAYDILPDQWQVVRQPDIVIVEGLTMLQTGHDRSPQPPKLFVSDFFDFSIYVDADEGHIQRWYVERFLTLRETVFRNQDSYFHRYAALSSDQAVQVADQLWREINAPNLRENIAPTRERAHLILKKGADHAVSEVLLRRL